MESGGEVSVWGKSSPLYRRLRIVLPREIKRLGSVYVEEFWNMWLERDKLPVVIQAGQGKKIKWSD